MEGEVVLMVEVVTIETPALGDRSYLAHDGQVAVVVDPQRDIDRVLAAAGSVGVRITHVLETHIHNDYVTGGHALARQAGAAYMVAAAERVGFDRVPVHDGQRFHSGHMSVTARHTPGHTADHMSYVLGDEKDEPVAVFTGGSMLFGAVGRTDLVSAEMTEALTRSQYRSVRLLAAGLPGATAVHPTHGFGSFCSAVPTTGNESTIAAERATNLALVTADEDEFVKRLVEGLTAYPRYYAHMGPANRAGPSAAPADPPERLSADELRRQILRGGWVVDLRQRRAFAGAHLPGTISVELGDGFSTYLGWTIQWGTPLTLIGESPEDVAGAQRQLARLGIDHLEGAATGTPQDLAGPEATASYEVTDFAGLAQSWGQAGQVVLDVRRPDEWEAGHLAGAAHVPLWELESRLGELSDGVVWVHCGSGFRASIAASLLARGGRRPVHVDDDWAAAAGAGLPLVEPDGDPAGR
ncbi:MAG: MBL fold metallo-hydrolase [Acidimicrobiales bacterium]